MRKLTFDEIKTHRLSESNAAQAEGRTPVIAILEDIRSLYNVGSMFRTSDGARLEALYTVGYTPHPPRPEIEKTALGATRTVPHRHFATIGEAIESSGNLGFRTAALEIAENSKIIHSLTPKDFPLALIFGNEVTGVSDTALALSDFTLEIPMLGAKHSLNVAVAFGIAVFECARVLRSTH